MSRAHLEHLVRARPFHAGGHSGLSGLRTAWHRFLAFVLAYDIDSDFLDAGIPGVGSKFEFGLNAAIARFAVYLGEGTPISGATIGTYCRNVFRIIVDSEGACGIRTSSQLDAILRYYGKASLTTQRLHRSSAPLHAIRRCLTAGATDPTQHAAHAAIGLCFSGGLRLGELIGASRRHHGLQWHQVDLIARAGKIQGIAVRLGLHKADAPARFTITAASPIGVVADEGRWRISGNQFCGVRAFVAWAAAAVIPAPTAAGASARQLALSCPKQGPVFVAGQRPLLKATVVRVLRGHCLLGEADTVHGHSIRIAAVMCLDRAGVAFETIRRFGRWKSASSCEVYLRSAREGLAPLELRGSDLQLK